jgi:FMN phosphatase YigB (HAD superfamily)
MDQRRRTIAFDLDETLGVPITDGRSIVGFQMRRGSAELLTELKSKNYAIVLWTVSSRAYVEKALNFGLGGYFEKTYTWDELPHRWKDVRTLGVDYLVDDSEYHRELAEPHGLASRYIIVPAYGSPDDNSNPLEWAERARTVLLPRD